MPAVTALHDAALARARATLARARAEFGRGTRSIQVTAAMAVLEQAARRHERILHEGEHGLGTWHDALALTEQQVHEARLGLIQAIADVRGEHVAAEIRGDEGDEAAEPVAGGSERSE